MQDFFMGAQVELDELALGEAPPAVTPPQGVILTELHTDGWTRRYLYKSRVDALGKAHPSKILVSEIPGDAPVQMGTEAPSQDHEIHLSRPVRVGIPSMGGNPLGTVPMASGFPTTPISGMPSPAMGDSRVNLPAHTAVPLLRQGAFLGQLPTAPPAAPAAPDAGSDVPLPLANATPPDASAPPPPDAGPLTLPACATAPIQLPDGTIINPDDAITLKDLCVMIPYLEKRLQQDMPQQQNGPVRPGGPIPLSRGFPGLPSFGPAGSGFAQGGFGGAGGGGGGNPPGAGPIGVVTGPTPTGGPGQSGGPGPVGPVGPPGPGNIIDGIQKTDGNFANTGAMAIIPGTTFDIVVGGNGNVALMFSAALEAPSRASIFNIFGGIQIDSTQYQLWESSEEQGAGSDQVFSMTMTGTLFINLPLGTHTISMIYGDNPAENHFTVVTSPTQPASVIAQHS